MKPTVVFVDDDANLRESFKRILRNKPYRALVLESAKQCVEVLAVTNIDVLITDLAMPGINGQTLIKFFKNTRPDVIRIVLSGNLDLKTTLDLINTGEVFRCIEKPCTSSKMLSTILEAVNLVNEKRSTQLLLAPQKIEPAKAQIPNQGKLTSLVQAAENEIDRLSNALNQQCEQERSNYKR